ncbi:MAG TPA: FkbM family methyltransferase [Candidatus Binatia bacterium]|jgi:FkbM family methyltransferase|nr:FkbM family methyltransferase [Candidatus Binatia bacterium]
MLETFHRVASRIRHSRFLDDLGIWEKVEPYWQQTFVRLSRHHGFSTCINEDIFKLEYAFGSRYDRSDNRRYEPVFYRAFVEQIEQGMTVFDIGAHIGLLTLGAAKRVGRNGRVYAFEPSPETAKILERHICLNRWQDRAEVVKAVVSDVAAVVPFYIYGVSMAASLGKENVEALNPEQPNAAVKIDVPSVTLDEFCKGRNIKPAIMKIDVEGAELQVLRGAKDLLLNESLSVLCEIHPRQMQYCRSSLPQLEAYLDSVGYGSKSLDQPNETGIFHSLITRRE